MQSLWRAKQSKEISPTNKLPNPSRQIKSTTDFIPQKQTKTFLSEFQQQKGTK